MELKTITYAMEIRRLEAVDPSSGLQSFIGRKK